MSNLYDAVEAIAEDMEKEGGELNLYAKMLRIALKAAGRQEVANNIPMFNGMEAGMAAALLAPESVNRSMIEKYKKKETPPEEMIEKLEEWMGGMAMCIDGPHEGEYVGVHAGMPIDAFCKVGEKEAVYQLKKDGLYQWTKKPEQVKIIAG